MLTEVLTSRRSRHPRKGLIKKTKKPSAMFYSFILDPDQSTIWISDVSMWNKPAGQNLFYKSLFILGCFIWMWCRFQERLRRCFSETGATVRICISIKSTQKVSPEALEKTQKKHRKINTTQAAADNKWFNHGIAWVRHPDGRSDAVSESSVRAFAYE